jgi:hypothetical protein
MAEISRTKIQARQAAEIPNPKHQDPNEYNAERWITVYFKPCILLWNL